MTAAVQRPRLEVIDAVRGVAALVVVVQHSAEKLWTDYARWSIEGIRPGEWGVFVFFMVSGFVIPLSIERDSDPVSFWIGRFFRLFPLYWVVLTGAILAWRLGDYGVEAGVDERPLLHVLANLTMVQNFLGSSDIVGVAWSLSYEMVFYLFVTGLIVAGLTRAALRSTLGAVALACTAGILISPEYVLRGEPRTKVVVVCFGVVMAAIAFLWPRLGSRRDQAIGVAAAGSVALLTLNVPHDLWFGLLLFATIGCGWTYHEAHRGRLPTWIPPALSAFTVLVAAFHFRSWVQPHEGPHGSFITWRADAGTLALAHVTFAAVYLFRHLGFPAGLRWLGQISYSLYLVHAVVINAWTPFPDRPWLTFLTWVTVTILISATTYRLVELPAQAAGRAVRSRWRSRQADSTTDPSREGPEHLPSPTLAG